MVLGASVHLCVTELDFFEKIPIVQNWPKMAQKQGFWTFQENLVISFVWNFCKKKVLMVLKILRKLHAWEKSGS